MPAPDKIATIALPKGNSRLVQYYLIAAQRVDDPTTTSTIIYMKSSSPISFRLSGTNTAAVTTHALTYNFGASKSFERWGSIVSANFNNQRIVSNTNNLTTQYQPALTFRVTQPLFKGREIDQARRSIKATKKRMDLTDAQFRQRVILI